MKKTSIIIPILASMLSACQGPGIPDNYADSPSLPHIYPDYTGVTIPCNMAPTNFMLRDTLATDCVARVRNSRGMEYIWPLENLKLDISISEWRSLLESSRNDSLAVEIFAHHQDSGWTRYKEFHIHIADSEIDPYISYRLIEPSYSVYGDMCIAQRRTDNFDESVIHSTKQTYGQCVNCHSYRNYSPGDMVYHRRVSDPGTVIRLHGEERVVNLKRDYTISSGVYPSWHPSENIIAFSTDKTHQLFHTEKNNKIEVFDTESDLVLYDIDLDEVSVIADQKSELEVFPTWSPCGRYLYYCSAHVTDSTFRGNYINDYQSLKYAILRMTYDPATRRFGEPDTIYDAPSRGLSCSLPRISPDGRKMIFPEGQYGYFHIWHHDSQIRMMDLETREIDSLHCLNDSLYADSYPTFSSNGQWIMLASRRDDGNYSRIFISYYDGQRAHKPFMLPQRSASHNIMRMKSYNRPEFMTGKVE